MTNSDANAVTVVGPEKINGADALHVHFGSDPADPENRNLWVDETTYEVVRIVQVNGGITFQADVDWLPRTPENLDLRNLQTPAGFTRTP